MTCYCNVANWTGRQDLWDIWLVRRNKFERVLVLTRSKKDRKVVIRRFGTVDAAKKYVEKDLIRADRVTEHIHSSLDIKVVETQPACSWFAWTPAALSWLKLYLQHLEF